MTTPTDSKARAALNEYGEEMKPTVQSDYQKEVNQWALFLHLSQLAGFIVPFAGLIVPIVIWQMKKADLPELDAHGKMVMNWTISEFIYGLALGIFMIVSVILFPLLICIIPIGLMFALAGVVFPIIGGLKANNGEFWAYPLAIQFLK